MKRKSIFDRRTICIQVVLALSVLLAAGDVSGSGFALYEPTAASHAMGGALVGKAIDASANYNFKTRWGYCHAVGFSTTYRF